MKNEPDEPIIKAEKLCFSFFSEESGKETRVLKNINLEINRGEFVAILGRNGSGKSTLAKHFNAIYTPNSGNVTVCGMDTSDESLLYDIREKVGMVFQNPDNQIVATIVEEDVAFAPENLGVPRDEMLKRIDYALSAVNMQKFRHHAPNMLSGGQKQRVAIAGVLAMMPKVLVLDEPTAMLDPLGRREILETVMRLNKEENMTVVLITHYMEEAIKADRIILIHDGEKVMEGTPREIFSHTDYLKSIKLDAAPAEILAQKLRRGGMPLPEGILSDSECAAEIIKCLEP